MSIYRYESIVIGMIFGPMIVLAVWEIAAHIQWMRNQKHRRNHPSNRTNNR